MTQGIWRIVGPDADLRVRATPNAAMDAIEGPGADASGLRFLKVRVRAPPEKGRANAAVELLLARALGVGKSAVSVDRGETQRIKRVVIAGGAQLAARLAELTGEADGC